MFLAMLKGIGYFYSTQHKYMELYNYIEMLKKLYLYTLMRVNFSNNQFHYHSKNSVPILPVLAPPLVSIGTSILKNSLYQDKMDLKSINGFNVIHYWGL